MFDRKLFFYARNKLFVRAPWVWTPRGQVRCSLCTPSQRPWIYTTVHEHQTCK